MTPFSYARAADADAAPPKVEYSLSPQGRTLTPVLAALKTWGDASIDRFAKVAA